MPMPITFARPSPEEYLRKLQPETIRSNLVRAGLFLAGWEMLKGQIQGHVRDFLWVGEVADPGGV
jgi:hypothetical protein